MRMMVSKLSWQPRDLAVAIVEGLIPLSMARLIPLREEYHICCPISRIFYGKNPIETHCDCEA